MIQYFKKIYNIRQVRFVLVGGILFLIDFIVTLFCYHILKLDPGIASAIGFCSSFIVGFTLNKKIVFTKSERARFSVRTQIVLYLILATLNLSISAWSVQILVSQGIWIEVVKPSVTILIACWNYVILGRFIFHSQEYQPGGS